MSEKPKVLLVDDDPALLRLLGIRLRAAGYDVDAVDSGEKALAHLAVFQPRVVITDLRMEGMDGMALFNSVRDSFPTLPVVILTAHGTIPDAVAATRHGVFAYVTKPFDSQELLDCVAKATQLGGAPFQDTPVDEAAWRRDIITRSARMEALLDRARLAARSEAAILIQGESGTGKELLARAIHRTSARASKPVVAVNCSAIPENLFESELFGHAKGSFTGAVREHKGLFQAADGGTLFLDEIGDMPSGFQAKLLRALQDKQIRPVGATAAVPVDVRVVSATHRDLGGEMAAERFREDLYYRLNVISLNVPSLSERREDIPLLAAHFLDQLQSDRDSRINGFSPEAMELLVQAPWPGNIRQLRNVIEQVVALATTPIVPAKLVGAALQEESSGVLSFAEARDRFERDYLVGLLRTTQGNVSQAARLAQRERSKFYKLLRRHQLDPKLFRSGPQ